MDQWQIHRKWKLDAAVRKRWTEDIAFYGAVFFTLHNFIIIIASATKEMRTTSTAIIHFESRANDCKFYRNQIQTIFAFSIRYEVLFLWRVDFQINYFNTSHDISLLGNQKKSNPIIERNAHWLLTTVWNLHISEQKLAFAHDKPNINRKSKSNPDISISK